MTTQLQVAAHLEERLEDMILVMELFRKAHLVVVVRAAMARQTTRQQVAIL
jgi:hypothetical protein